MIGIFGTALGLAGASADDAEAGDGKTRGAVVQRGFADVGEALDAEEIDDVDVVIFLQVENLQAGVADANFREPFGGEDVCPVGDGVLGAGAAEGAIAGQADAGQRRTAATILPFVDEIGAIFFREAMVAANHELMGLVFGGSGGEVLGIESEEAYALGAPGALRNAVGCCRCEGRAEASRGR